MQLKQTLRKQQKLYSEKLLNKLKCNIRRQSLKARKDKKQTNENKKTSIGNKIQMKEKSN